MKTLLLVGCASMATAVLAPQFPQNFYAVGNTGECCCNSAIRTPHSICVMTITPSTSANAWSTTAGALPANFVITDVVVGFDTSLANSSSRLPENAIVLANGVAVCTTQCNVDNQPQLGYWPIKSTTGAQFQHGVVVPAGSLISVVTNGARAYVTLSGYLVK